MRVGLRSTVYMLLFEKGTDIYPPMERVTRLASETGDLPSPLATAARYSA